MIRVALFCTLLLLIVSCSSPVQVKQVVIRPPAHLLAPCERSAYTGKTWGDLANYTVKVKKERDICSQRLENIKIWHDTLTSRSR